MVARIIKISTTGHRAVKMKTPLAVAVTTKALFVAIVAAIYISVLFSYPQNSNLAVLVTSFAVVTYATSRSFFRVKYNYSIYQFFYIFSLLFMGIAPLVQYKQSVQTVGGYDISDSTYAWVNIILLVVFIVIDSIYSYRNKKLSRSSQVIVKKDAFYGRVNDTLFLKIALLSVSMVSLIYVIYINQYDLLGIFYRDVLIDRVEIENSTTLIMTGAIRPLSIFAFIFYYKFGTNKLFKLILFLLALVTCFPAALTRFYAGAYWVPVILTIFYSLNTKKILGYAYTAGILILFPAFEIFRAMSLYATKEDVINEFFKRVSEAFTSMSYDSYQSLAFVVQNEFVTYGQQLLGVVGLFIPRVIWESKPIGSGFTVAQEFGLGFDNISMNFFGEGYINFGLIGILIFAIGLAIAMRYLDGRYWTRGVASGALFPVIYLVILGIFAYIMRGDMIGSFTSTVAVIISATFVYFVTVGIGRFKVPGKSNGMNSKLKSEREVTG